MIIGIFLVILCDNWEFAPLKRFFNILQRVILAILLLIGIVFLVMCSSRVQTFVVNKVTTTISESCGNDIQIGRVRFKPFNNLNVTEIYIEDLDGDTLLYIPEIDARFNLFNILKNRITIRDIAVIEPYINIQTDTAGVANYAFLLDRFGDDTAKEKKPFNKSVEIDKAAIIDGRIAHTRAGAPAYRDGVFHADRCSFSDINLKIALKEFQRGDINAKIEHFSLREQSGFELIDFQAHLIFDTAQLTIPTLRLEMPHSLIDVSVLKAYMPQRKAESHRLDPQKTQIEFVLDYGTIALSDIGAFVPAVRNIDNPIDISAVVEGILGDLNLTNLSIYYDTYQLIDGTLTIQGLPYINDSTCFRADVNKIGVSPAIIQDFMSDLNNRPYVIPEIIERLGEVRYCGAAHGNSKNVWLSGGFTSSVGSVSTIGSLKKIVLNDSTHKGDFVFNGAIETQQFQLGRLLAQDKMGNISLKVDADGKLDTLERINISANGKVSEFEYNGYAYQDLNINGNYNGHSFRGSLNMHDPHLWFDFDGMADWHSEDPRYNFNLNISQLHPGELKLIEGDYADIQIRVNADINLTGNSLDNLNGTAILDDLYFYNDSDEITIPQVKLSSRMNYYTEKDQLKLTSDYLNIDINGLYVYSELPITLQKFAMRYLPNFFSDEQKRKLNATHTDNELTIDILSHNLPKITQILATKLQFTDDISIKGTIDEDDNIFELGANIPGIDFNKMQLRDIGFNLSNEHDAALITLRAKKLLNPNKPGSVHMGDLTTHITMLADNDSILTGIRFNNDSVHQLTRGNARILTTFTSSKGKPFITANLFPAEMYILDIPWRLEETLIEYSAADATLDVNNFRFFSLSQDEEGSSLQHIFIDGRGSNDMNDALSVNLKDIGLAWVVGISGFFGIDFDGRITGNAAFYGMFKQPIIEANLDLKDFGMNDIHIGHAKAQAEWLKDIPALHYFGDVYHDDTNKHLSHLDGMFKPKKHTWNIGIDSEGVPIDFVNMWIKPIFGSMRGQIYGRVDIDGDTTGAVVTADALIKNGALDVDIIGMTYHFEDTVKLTTDTQHDTILFNDITFHDDEGHPVGVNGYVAHNRFKNFNYNLDIKCTNAQVINLPHINDNFIFGKAFATGSVSINGNQRYGRFNINARTRPNTNVGISLDNSSTAVDNDFITFKSPILQTSPAKSTVSRQNASSTSYILNLGLNIDVTPDALITLDIDKRTGDAIQARGDGNIVLAYQTPSGDTNLRGQLAISTGNVSYTISNILRKEFKIQEGSSVTFNGQPMNTKLDVTAYYQTTASLRDLMGEQFSQAGLNRSYVPVNCIIGLGGTLNNPEISYDISLPNSDETARQQVSSIINTEEMKMREILYLLAFNKFYTPDYLSSTNQSDGTAESLSLLSSTVTGQLNNWINKVTKDLQLGFNVHTSGAGSEMSQEYEGQFAYQLNNRLEINGNFGYRSNDISNRPFFGDIDIEYLLTESGKYRIKGYTHSVDKYSLKQASTIQGVGLIYKENFDTFRELFRINRSSENTNLNDNNQNPENKSEDSDAEKGKEE